MALLHCSFFSETLGTAASMDVILPEQATAQIGMPGTLDAGTSAVLYLLHGLSDDHTIWQRRTSIERYVAPLNLAVVMPSVHRSFYTDMRHGYPYWTFVADELPTKVERFFRVSQRREKTAVAGLSMGGYGAFKLALRRPDRFAAAASLSGALDIAALVASQDNHSPPDLSLVFGADTPVEGSRDDLFACARSVAAEGAQCPRLYQWCGTEDFLYEDNLKFRDHALNLGLPLTYEEGPGQHEWGAWDRQIQRVLEWMGFPPTSGSPKEDGRE